MKGGRGLPPAAALVWCLEAPACFSEGSETRRDQVEDTLIGAVRFCLRAPSAAVFKNQPKVSLKL